MNHIRDLQEKLSALHFELEEEDDAGQRYSKSFYFSHSRVELVKKAQFALYALSILEYGYFLTFH